MARIFNDGGELGDMLFWSAYTGSITSTEKRSGTYSYTNNNNENTKNIPNLSEFYLRVGFKRASTGFTVSWYNLTSNLGYITVNGISYCEAYVNGSKVSTGSGLVSLADWNLLELRFLLSDTGIIQTKLNGVSDINYSGDTRPSSYTYIDNLHFGAAGSTTVYTDDYALNDTTGTVDNSWCGDGHYEFLVANAEGDTLQWTPSSGGVHYAMVDDVPSDGDTTYITTSGTGLRDMFNLASFTDTNKTILRIFPEGRAKDAQAIASEIKLGIKTNGTVYLGSGIVLSSVYSKVVGSDYFTYPASGTIWTKDVIDSIQFVTERENSVVS